MKYGATALVGSKHLGPLLLSICLHGKHFCAVRWLCALVRDGNRSGCRCEFQNLFPVVCAQVSELFGREVVAGDLCEQRTHDGIARADGVGDVDLDGRHFEPGRASTQREALAAAGNHHDGNLLEGLLA